MCVAGRGVNLCMDIFPFFLFPISSNVNHFLASFLAKGTWARCGACILFLLLFVFLDISIFLLASLAIPRPHPRNNPGIRIKQDELRWYGYFFWGGIEM